MKFLLEFVACCGPCSSEEKQQPADETGLLVVQEQQQQPRRRAGRKQGRSSRGGSGEWRPSLSSISEEVLVAERMNHSVERPIAGWGKSLKRKVSYMSRRDRNQRYLDHDERRRTPSSFIVPAFAPTPFMF